MKSKIFQSRLLAVMFCCLSTAMAQTQLPAPGRPTPGTGKTQRPGTVTGGTQNVINSKLMIYTRNGLATLSTNTSGEFPAQLLSAANANQDFSLQWSRPQPGKAEKGNLFITPQNTTAWVAVQSVSMPAGSTAVNLQYSIPNLGPKTYELRIVTDSGSSSKVTINYSGNGGNSQPIVVTPVSNGGPSTATKTPIYITGATFTPMIGAPGVPGYKRARLTLVLRTTQTATISNIEVDGQSEPWTNPELLTNSNSKNSPITILSGKWSAGGGSKKILADQDNPITITLRANSKKDIQADETGPGFYSPGDWGFAFSQTTTASFRWTVNGAAGTVSGSLAQSPKKPWQWGNP